MVRPLDPRLLRTARSARRYVVLTAVLGTLSAGLVVAGAVLLARIIAGVAMDGETFADVTPALAGLAAVAVARAAVAGAQERFGHRAATGVIGELRAELVRHVTALGPGAAEVRPCAGRDPGAGDRESRPPHGQTLDAAATATLATRGIEALDGYLTRYLPQLLLTAIVTPSVLAVIWWQDGIAGWTVLVTLPLVPLFMALVGLATQAAADRRLRTMQRLGAQVLDLVAGLPTLRAFGRELGQAKRVREVGEAYRRATMRTLRSAFLSALVLETLTTLSVALVAVGVGLRLVHGELDLQTGLLVLILAPEVYLPLRMVGAGYHASVDGLAAATQVFGILERPLPEPGTRPAPDLRAATIRLDGVSVVHPGARRATPAGLDAELRPGTVVALVGANGCGKSTAAAALLGLARPTRGRITVWQQHGPVTDLADVDPASWRAQLAWVPQHPVLVPGTVAENVRLTAPQATDDELATAARVTGLDDVLAALPGGWATRVGHGGAGLSAGERQRVALTRALLSGAPLVVLDEPTAHLDAGSEAVVHRVVAALRAAGRTVVVVAHRRSLIATADDVVTVQAADLPANDTRPAPPAESAAIMHSRPALAPDHA